MKPDAEAVPMKRLRHNKECIAPLHDERYSFKKSIAYWAESIEPFASTLSSMQ